MLNQTQKAQIVKLRAEGASYRTIAKELSIGKQTAIDFCKENDEIIQNAKAEELEAFQEEWKISKEARLESLSQLKLCLWDEISKRNFADVPTDKLITLYLNTTAAIKDEAVEPRFKSTDEQEQDKQDREFLDRLTKG